MQATAAKPQALATSGASRSEAIAFAVMAVAFIVAPAFAYPLFLMQALCFALFACAFNLLIGYVGLLSFGHALYFGWASYLAAHAAKVWGFPPRSEEHTSELQSQSNLVCRLLLEKKKQ